MKAIVCALVMGLMVPSFAGAVIEDIQVSNNATFSVTISWTTDSSVMGEVHYSQNPDLSGSITAYDVRGQFTSGCTHYVEIAGLTKATFYYFEVVAGGETDDNGGSYYTFTTMKEQQSLPTPCSVTGCVYEEDGTTLAVGPMVYLWVTHGGVESYPLSDLLGSPGDATPGCFAFDISLARSTVTDDLFPPIVPGDPIRIEALDCGNYRADDMGLNTCFDFLGFMTLAYTPPGTTTTSNPVTTTSVNPTTTTSADPTTTTSADPTTTTSADPTTTTSADPTTTTSVPAATTSVPAATTSVPAATTSVPVTTTSTPSGGCTTDAECDDGTYCNGAETCDTEAGCRPGSAPCTNDGEFCNGVEGCDEEADACVSSGDPCREDEVCNEEEDTCESAVSIEASIEGCGLPFFPRLGIVTLQGTGTEFKALSVVKYDSPLVVKSLKLLDRDTQTITQFVLLRPSIVVPAWDYSAMVTVEVDTLESTFTIPVCGR